MVDYEVSYTARDLILYALSLGMGSRPEDADELKFLYEQHGNFMGVATFCFAFTFWAQRKQTTGVSTTTQGIPPFPPPLMSEEEVIPGRFLKNNMDISGMPVIHTWQSIVWHHPMEVPNGQCNPVVTNKIDLETIVIQPKSIGTFVTSQSKVTTTNTNHNHQQPPLLCTIQSTALVLGLDPSNVAAFDARVLRQSCNPKIPSNEAPLFEWTYQTSQSQALLYRMASGDSNHIHVDTSAADMLGSEIKAPLLHGLFTLALGFRGIAKLLESEHYQQSLRSEFGNNDYRLVFRKLEGVFKAPGFVGDRLCVKIWKDRSCLPNNTTRRLLFVIVNTATGAKLVNNGCAEIEITSKALSSAHISRL